MPIYRIFKIIAIILGVIGSIYLGMVIYKGDDVITATGEGVSGFLIVSYITFGITILLVLLFVLKGLFSGNVKRTLIPIAGFLIVVVISYALADGTPMQLREGDALSGSGAKWVETGLYVFYIMGVLAIGSMIYTSIKKTIS